MPCGPPDNNLSRGVDKPPGVGYSDRMTTTTTTTTTDTPLPTHRGSTTTITPDGFINQGTIGYYAARTRSRNTPTWTFGVLQRVADVIGPDWPCLIEVDNRTRHTVVGRIVAVQADYRQPQGWACVIKYGDGADSHRTAHAGLSIGAITPLPGPHKAPSYYDVTRRMHDERIAAITAWWEHVKAETGGYHWYGKSTLHAGPNGTWHLYYESQENDRHDVTRPHRLSDGTERKEYAYGPLEATFTIGADGTVLEGTRREHYDPAVLAWRQVTA